VHITGTYFTVGEENMLMREHFVRTTARTEHWRILVAGMLRVKLIFLLAPVIGPLFDPPARPYVSSVSTVLIARAVLNNP
jgi:hypothetical protein